MAKNPKISCAEPGCTAETKPVKFVGTRAGFKGMHWVCTAGHVLRNRIVDHVPTPPKAGS